MVVMGRQAGKYVNEKLVSNLPLKFVCAFSRLSRVKEYCRGKKSNTKSHPFIAVKILIAVNLAKQVLYTKQ